MSFYYLKNINFKNQTLKAAHSNIRPLIYCNIDYKELSQDDFIKENRKKRHQSIMKYT